MNRDNIRWAPFNSVINGNDVIKELKDEQSRFKKPVLSEEQINELEEQIMDSYFSKTKINIIYYKNEHAYKTQGIVTKINSATKNITINDKNTIYFGNILKIM